MPFEILRNDITKLNTDAIVNAANSQLQAGGGVCGAIFSAAGRQALQRACDKIGHCPVGSAVITPGFDLKAKYVIHAVGPIWQGGDRQEPQLLAGAYRSALELAAKKRCGSIAFPLISAGIYGYPRQQALQIAIDTIRKFLEDHEMHVVLALYERSVLELAEDRMGAIRTYIDDHYVDAMTASLRRNDWHAIEQQAAEQAELFEDGRAVRESYETIVDAAPRPCPTAPCVSAPRQSLPLRPQKASRTLSDLLDNMGESFSHMLLRLIDEKGLTDVDVYKRANLDRKHFSKLRKDSCHPTKATVLALAIALELNLDQTVDFLAKAGYALSPSSKFDVIIGYFIESQIYDIYEINQALFAFEQHLLGA